MPARQSRPRARRRSPARRARSQSRSRDGHPKNAALRRRLFAKDKNALLRAIERHQGDEDALRARNARTFAQAKQIANRPALIEALALGSPSRAQRRDEQSRALREQCKFVVLLDFDHTVTAQHMWYATNGRNDPSLLTPAMLNHLFDVDGDGGKYLAFLKRFWATLHQNPQVEVQILSNSFEPMIEAALRGIGLDPMPSKITGRIALSRYYGGQKGVYINSEISSRPELSMSRAIFVDDTKNERQYASMSNESLRTCCDDLTRGLTPSVVRKIVSAISAESTACLAAQRSA